MKRIIILTLLLFTAAFSFSQSNTTTNGNFKNLDVWGRERVYGPLYIYDTVYFKTTNANIPFLPTGDPLGWVLGTQKNTGKLVRVPMANLSDSTCLFYLVGDTAKTIYNVVVDSSFIAIYNGSRFGYYGDFAPYPYLEMTTSWGDTSSSIWSYSQSSSANSSMLSQNTSNKSALISAKYDQSIRGGGANVKLVALDYSDLGLNYKDGYIDLYTDSLSMMIREMSPLIYSKIDMKSDYIKFTSDSINLTSDVYINGDLTVTGQVKYDFKHLVAYLTAGSYTPNVSTNTPFKLAPGMTVSENDGLTFAGDSITIITPGDYKLDLAGVMSAEGANWKITVRKNGVLFTSGHCAFTTTGSSIYNTFSWFYYLVGLVAGDDISFYITNETGSNDPTFRAFKIYIEMKPE